jgi:hypothetical protein
MTPEEVEAVSKYAALTLGRTPARRGPPQQQQQEAEIEN